MYQYMITYEYIIIRDHMSTIIKLYNILLYILNIHSQYTFKILNIYKTIQITRILTSILYFKISLKTIKF